MAVAYILTNYVVGKDLLPRLYSHNPVSILIENATSHVCHLLKNLCAGIFALHVDDVVNERIINVIAIFPSIIGRDIRLPERGIRHKVESSFRLAGVLLVHKF